MKKLCSSIFAEYTPMLLVVLVLFVGISLLPNKTTSNYRINKQSEIVPEIDNRVSSLDDPFPFEYIPNTTSDMMQGVFNISEDLNLAPVSSREGIQTGFPNFPKLTWQDQIILEKTGGASIDMVYPQFIGGNFVKKINEHIKSIINTIVENNKAEGRDLTSSEPESYLSTIDVASRYRVIGVTNGIVSMEMVVTEYTGGGNGNHNISTVINWDLKFDRLLNSDELFCSKNYLEILKPVVTEKIISDFDKNPYVAHPLNFKVTIWTEPGDYHDFLLNKDGLIAVFQPYQITSGNVGTIRAFIPASSIPNLLCLPN